MVSQLNCALVSKSEAYTEPGVKALFRLNNSNYVLKTLQRSALLEYVALSEPDCEESYHQMIQTHKKAYEQRLVLIKIIEYFFKFPIISFSFTSHFMAQFHRRSVII